MTPDYVQALARYNRWMNEKLYDVSSRVSDEDRKRDRGAFFKSIHATLNHILLADRVWMARFTGVKVEDGFMGPGGIRSLDQELYAHFDELRAERAKTDGAIDEWARSLSQADLAGTLRFLRRGARAEVPFWWAAGQMFNHETHHRGQISTLLTQAGHDLGVTDFFAMLLEQSAKTW